MYRRHCWLLVCGVLLAVLAPSPTLAAGKPTATVQAATGALNVRRARAANLVPISVRGSLFAGDMVGTGPGGKAALLFADGSTMRIAANAALEITPPTKVKGRTSLCRVVSGEVWARLRPGKAVQTRNAIAGVRGPELGLSVAEDGTATLTVLAGEVEFSNDLGSVVVGESEQSTARSGTAPSPQWRRATRP